MTPSPEMGGPDVAQGTLPDQPTDQNPAKDTTQDNEFYLPDSFPGIEKLKEGDSVTLTVLRKDDDGSVAVEPAAEDTTDDKSWEADARQNVGNQ